ncbi:hypothetical protein ABZ825_13600 [Streptomyces tauricus]|uniref:hypothetical protein n=1 Tax=Streptomyces tauricus TaxID=68274 RepID=UPI0033FCB738
MAAEPVLKRIERCPCCYRIPVRRQPLQHTGGKFAVFKPSDVGTEMQRGFRCRCPELLTHPGPGRQLVRGHAAFKRVLYLHDRFPLESRPFCGQTDLRFFPSEQPVTPEGAGVGQLLPEQRAETSQNNTDQGRNRSPPFHREIVTSPEIWTLGRYQQIG